MKKMAVISAGAVLSATLFAGSAFADLKMKVAGKAVEFQYGTPFIEDGNSLMPLRDLLIALGVPNDDEHIKWIQEEKAVVIKQGDTVVTLKVGDKKIYKNGSLFKELEVPAEQVADQDYRVFLPARAVAEALSNKVGYDAETGTVLVDPLPTVSMKSAEGVSITLPPQNVADGQVYGLVTAANQQKGTITVKTADGSLQEVAIADDTRIVLMDGMNETGTEFKQYLSAGEAALLTLEGSKLTKLEISYPTYVVTVKSVKQESITYNDGTGEKKGTSITVTAVADNGKEIQLDTMDDIKLDNGVSLKDLKGGEKLTVTGSLSTMPLTADQSVTMGSIISVKLAP